MPEVVLSIALQVFHSKLKSKMLKKPYPDPSAACQFLFALAQLIIATLLSHFARSDLLAINLYSHGQPLGLDVALVIKLSPCV